MTPGPALRGPLPHIDEPFASFEYVELHDRIDAHPVTPSTPVADVAFVDGIQRFAVEARLGLVPIVRGHVAAAVLRRCDGRLEVEAREAEDFLVAATHALSSNQMEALSTLGLPIHDVEAGETAHPMLDIQRAARVVDRRRELLERRLCRIALSRPTDRWLVVDGSIGGIADAHGGERVLGVIKSHETQFLRGRDLEIALTLPPNHRSSVFARHSDTRGPAYTWYLRLWPWEDEDLLHGLVRVERTPGATTVDEADAVSAWLLTERTPLSTPDARWDRLLYPIHQVEVYLRAQLGGWW